MSGIIFTCKLCGTKVAKEDIFRHRLDVHGIKKVGGGKKKSLELAPTPKPKASNPALERLAAIKKEIDVAIKDLEFERDNHHRKVLELDKTIASYQKMLITNGHQ